MAGTVLGTVALESTSKVRTYQAGASVTALDLLQLSASQVIPAATGTADATLVGVALNAGGSGDYVSVLYSGSFDPGFTAVKGAMYYLGTAGADTWTTLTSDITTAHYVHHLGFATAADSVTIAFRATGATAD